MDKSITHPDFKEIAKQASYDQITDLLFALGKLRYATFKQLHKINFRVARKGHLVNLEELGYIKSIPLVKNDKTIPVYYITEKTRDLLKREKYNTDILQAKFNGKELTHALLITDAILKLKPWTVFYPQFKEPPDYGNDWLKPDACLIFKNDTGFKIQFLEVEEEKQDWERYLLGKREKYERLATDANLFFAWWKHKSQKLGLPYGLVEEFCFSVLCYRKYKM